MVRRKLSIIQLLLSALTLATAFTMIAKAEECQEDPPLKFYAIGLPQGTYWSVTIIPGEGQQSQTTRGSTGSQITFGVQTGTYDYSVNAPSGYAAEPNSGSIDVQQGGADVYIRFYALQNYFTLTIQTNPPDIVQIPGSGEYPEGTEVWLEAPEFVVVSVDFRYKFNYWDVDGTAVEGNPILVRMNANHIATAHYVEQYYLTVKVDPEGLVKISGEGWYDKCTEVELTAPEYVPSEEGENGVRYRFDHWSVDGTQFDGNSIEVHMDAAHKVTAHYVKQYYLTLETNPVGVTTPSGKGWYDENTKANISTDEYVDIVSGESRYRFDCWTTGDMNEIANPSAASTTVLMDKAKTVTAKYVMQYNVTFTQTGLDDSAIDTIVTVDGEPKTYDDLPFSKWVDEKSKVTYAYENFVSSSTSGKRFRLDSIVGPSSPLTVTAATTVTGNYVTQYYLTVESEYDTPSGEGWYDEGSIAYATLDYGIEYVNGVPYGFVGWSGDASGIWLTSNPITMDGPKTAVALWEAAGATYGDVRTVGFWRHQFTVWYRTEVLKLKKGTGTAQVSVQELLGYLKLIRTNSEYFDDLIPDPDSNPNGALMYAYTLLAPLKAHTMKEAAEQQLFAVWLNLARKAFFTYQELSQSLEYIYQTYDLKTIAEAIQWCEANISTQAAAVKDICDSINNNLGIIW
ncbi:MAG: hypothetical protein QW222_07195 [Candidatus Bathyarchaeia archaeon]